MDYFKLSGVSLILLAIVALVPCTFSASCMDKYDQTEEENWAMLIFSCAQKVGAMSVKKPPKTDDDWKTVDYKDNCLGKCILEESNFLTKGRLNRTELIKDVHSYAPKELQKRLIDIVKGCADTTEKQAKKNKRGFLGDVCKYSAMFLSCYDTNEDKLC